METLITLFEKYGVWGLVLLVAVYILLNSKFTIQYPRDCIFQTIPAMDSVPFRPPIPFDPGH